MKKLLGIGQDYIDNKMTIWDLGALKFCLCAVGVILGLNVSKEKKKPAFVLAALVFLAAFIPLMARFIAHLIEALSEYKPFTFNYGADDELPWD